MRTTDPELVSLYLGTIYLLAGGIGGPWALVYGHVLMGAIGILIGIAGLVTLTWAFHRYQWPLLKLWFETYRIKKAA